MGIVQGLTEFLPISSSGHLLLVPYLFGWDDPFIESLAFSVVLHAGTLAALLVYFRDDWRRLIPAGLATLRDRSFQGDPGSPARVADRRATIPAVIAALLFNDLIEDGVPPGMAGRADARRRRRDPVARRPVGRADAPAREHVVPWRALGVGIAQALALIPGVSRSGISMSAALFAGLDRADAARYSFLMATPITALAVGYEGLKLVRGEVVGADALAS